MDNATRSELSATDGYESPELAEYGSIEEWTQGTFAETINVSLVF